MESGADDEHIFRLLDVLDQLERESPEAAANAPLSPLAQRVKNLRQRIGASQRIFAQFLGVSASMVGHMEQGAADKTIARHIDRLNELEAKFPAGANGNDAEPTPASAPAAPESAAPRDDGRAAARRAGAGRDQPHPKKAKATPSKPAKAPARRTLRKAASKTAPKAAPKTDKKTAPGAAKKTPARRAGGASAPAPNKTKTTKKPPKAAAKPGPRARAASPRPRRRP